MANAIYNGFNVKENCIYYIKNEIEKDKLLQEELNNKIEKEKDTIKSQKDRVENAIKNIGENFIELNSSIEIMKQGNISNASESSKLSEEINEILEFCNKLDVTLQQVNNILTELSENNDEVVEIKSNVKLIGCDLGDRFTSDFVCTKTNGELMVVECIEKEKLLKPLTCKMLDCSRNYWLSKGVNDWRLVIGEESNN